MALPPFKKIQGIPEVLDTSNEGAQTCPIHSTSGSVGGAIIIRKCCGEGISEGVAPLLLYLLQFWWLMLYYIHIDRKNYPPTTLTHLSWIIAIHGTLHHGHHPSGTFRIPLATEGLTVHASSEVLGPQEEGVHHETWGLKRQTWRLSLMCDRYVGV